MALRPLTINGILLGSFVPSLVNAHNFFGDTQPLLNGVAHPFVTLPHIVLLCALILAFLWQEKIHFGIMGIILGFIIGFCGRAFFSLEILPLYPLILAFILLWGVIIVAKKSLPAVPLLILTSITGLLIGLDTDSQMDNWFFTAVFCVGSLVGILALLAYGSFAKRFLKQEWVCILVQTLGAWLIAVGAMMMTFFLTGQ